MMAGRGSTTHGLSALHNRHPMYNTWAGMKQRCLNPKATSYKQYGARGIKVCDRWLIFENFYDDMFPTWEQDLELDRIDNDGNYEFSNCRWVTSMEQTLNKRPQCKPTNFGAVSQYEKSLWGRPGTIRTYSNLFKNHIAEHVTEKEIVQLNENTMLGFIQLWLNDGLGDRTIKQLVRMLTRYCKYLGGTPPETAPLLRKLSRQKQENSIKSLTAKEAKLLLDYLSDKHLSLYLICLFGIHAGLRRGEIFGLQYGDIDALKNRITVQRSYNGPTKNGKTRVVPLSERLAKALESKDYLTKPAGEAILKNFDPNADIAKVCKYIKIKEITVHNLRHTFATLALEKGVSPRTVQGWLGHSSLTTTLNIYWSALPTEQRMDFAP